WICTAAGAPILSLYGAWPVRFNVPSLRCRPLNSFLPVASVTSSQQSAVKFITSAFGSTAGAAVPAGSVGSDAAVLSAGAVAAGAVSTLACEGDTTAF